MPMKRTFILLIFILFLCACQKSEDVTLDNINQETESKQIISMENLPMYEYRVEEINVKNGTNNIYGQAYIPITEESKVPLVILSHGLGGNYTDNIDYAIELASHGIAAYTFDFIGGGGNKSDGSISEMSVLTEVSDLDAVIEAVSNWNFVEDSKIVLLGSSQGGIVSAISAAENTETVDGLILAYPAFNVTDTIRTYIEDYSAIPDSYDFGWISLGRIYATDMWDYDVYEVIGNYNKPVLIMHGDSDELVPVEYSKKATDIYENATFYIVEGAGHGFEGDDLALAKEYIFEYLQRINVI